MFRLTMLTAGLTLSVVSVVLAHHSTAMYDTQHPVTVTGVVKRFEWVNPHAHIYLDVTDEKDAKGVGQGLMMCPFCEGDCKVRRLFLGRVTKIRVLMPVPCRCTFYKKFYSRWLNPAIVSADYRDVTMRNIDRYKQAFSTFLATGKFEEMIDTVHTYWRNCYLMVVAAARAP